MSRFARVAAAVLALLAALYCRMPASAYSSALSANLSLARMFDPAAETLFAALVAPPKRFSPIGSVLFDTPDTEIAMVRAAAEPPPSAGSGTTAIVTLQAYTAPQQLPSAMVAPAAVVPAVQPAPAHLAAHLAGVPVRFSTSVPEVHFGAYRTYTPALQSLHEDVRVPVRVGPVHFSGIVHGMQQQSFHTDAIRAMQLCGTTDEAAACPYLHDEGAQSVAAGTDFNVRTGGTRVNLQLSGSVGRVDNRDAMYQYVPLDPDRLSGAQAGSPQDSSLMYYPGLTQMVRHGVNAALAVPVSPVLTLGLQYDSAHYQGNYATQFAPGLDARKDTYLGNVTYKLPNSSLITLSARQYRYEDSFAPNFNLTETRADLSFTVKF